MISIFQIIFLLSCLAILLLLGGPPILTALAVIVVFSFLAGFFARLYQLNSRQH